ncbi:glutathione S-transferase family protein [Rhizobium sp. AAP43]|uniref:glutathione S-transferase family protein n=1 Tax=Rhizobium sp. AAP43 TaxID=1523420 RepID=UPI0006B890B1|nr:glutathione S-transferase [Rhizobium sp. AAP43]KPF45584.1 glutathione S-transferase [Rhizobium sp. AAP43]
MITVHYLDNSRAHRILWLLEELGVEYQVTVYPRTSEYRAPEGLKAIHPLGKSPVIQDGGKVVAESGAIMEYLIETYGGEALVPAAGTDERLRYRYWMHYAEGSAMPLLVMKLIFSRIPKQVPFFIRPIARMISDGVSRKLLDPQLADHLDFWIAELGKGDWFAGEAFSAADIAMSFPVEAGMTAIGSDRDTSRLRDWMNRIRARPAYQRALARGGKYRYSTS